jgi:outer membrane protein TolC
VVQRIPTGAEVSVGWSNMYNTYTNLNKDDYTSRFSVKVTQPILRGAGLTVGTAPQVLSGLDDDENFWSYRWSATQILTLAEKRYWDLALTEANLTAVEEAASRTRDLLVLLRARTGRADWPELAAELAARDVDRATAELSRTRANLRLLDLLDLPGLDEVKPVTGLIDRPGETKVELKPSLEAALVNRPDLRRSQVLVDSAALRSEVARSNALQELAVAVEAASRATEPAFGRAVSQSFNLGDQWLFTLAAEVRVGRPQDLRVRDAVAAEHRHLKAKLDLAERRQTVTNEVTTAVLAAETIRAALGQALQALRLARAKVDEALTDLERGQVDVLKLVIYQRDIYAARLRALAAAADHLSDLADLGQATGATLPRWGLEIVQDQAG